MHGWRRREILNNIWASGHASLHVLLWMFSLNEIPISYFVSYFKEFKFTFAQILFHYFQTIGRRACHASRGFLCFPRTSGQVLLGHDAVRSALWKATELWRAAPDHAAEVSKSGFLWSFSSQGTALTKEAGSSAAFMDLPISSMRAEEIYSAASSFLLLLPGFTHERGIVHSLSACC